MESAWTAAGRALRVSEPASSSRHAGDSDSRAGRSPPRFLRTSSRRSPPRFLSAQPRSSRPAAPQALGTTRAPRCSTRATYPSHISESHIRVIHTRLSARPRPGRRRHPCVRAGPLPAPPAPSPRARGPAACGPARPTPCPPLAPAPHPTLRQHGGPHTPRAPRARRCAPRAPPVFAAAIRQGSSPRPGARGRRLRPGRACRACRAVRGQAGLRVSPLRPRCTGHRHQPRDSDNSDGPSQPDDADVTAPAPPSCSLVAGLFRPTGKAPAARLAGPGTGIAPSANSGLHGRRATAGKGLYEGLLAGCRLGPACSLGCLVL